MFSKNIAQLYADTLEALTTRIAVRDQATQGCVSRTRVYTTELGRLARINEFEIEALSIAALLHDVPTPDNKEFDGQVGFPSIVGEIIRLHQEKWDGSGKPYGLIGEQIPLLARIFSIASFYSGLRGAHTTRDGVLCDDSTDVLRDMAHTHFDPHLVSKFVENIAPFEIPLARHDIRQPASFESVSSEEVAQACDEIFGSTALLENESGIAPTENVRREVFALQEISRSIGSSLNLQDTLTLVSGMLPAVVPFDTCAIFFVEENTGTLHA
ncbi:MAG: HD domain-containing phosphohydrolase, partial [Pyrinomonadaceae bacterium]